MEQETNNPLLCDIESGICQMPSTNPSAHQNTLTIDKKPVRVIYFTDPIGSSCWGIEPQLRKLKLEYGNSIDLNREWAAYCQTGVTIAVGSVNLRTLLITGTR